MPAIPKEAQKKRHYHSLSIKAGDSRKKEKEETHNGVREVGQLDLGAGSDDAGL